jgi:hypothetical protein
MTLYATARRAARTAAAAARSAARRLPPWTLLVLVLVLAAAWRCLARRREGLSDGDCSGSRPYAVNGMCCKTQDGKKCKKPKGTAAPAGTAAPGGGCPSDKLSINLGGSAPQCITNDECFNKYSGKNVQHADKTWWCECGDGTYWKDGKCNCNAGWTWDGNNHVCLAPDGVRNDGACPSGFKGQNGGSSDLFPCDQNGNNEFSRSGGIRTGNNDAGTAQTMLKGLCCQWTNKDCHSKGFLGFVQGIRDKGIENTGFYTADDGCNVNVYDKTGAPMMVTGAGAGYLGGITQTALSMVPGAGVFSRLGLSLAKQGMS